MSDPNLLAQAMHKIAYDHPDWLPSQVKAQAELQVRADEADAVIAAFEADMAGWQASGRPLSELFDGSWKDGAAAQATYDEVHDVANGGVPELTADEHFAGMLDQYSDPETNPFEAGQLGRILNLDALREEAEDAMRQYAAQRGSMSTRAQLAKGR